MRSSQVNGRMLMRFVSLTLVALCSVAPVAFAGTNAPAPDAKILALLHIGDVSEVAQGEIAKDRTQNAGVRDFAVMLVTDHSKADQNVLQLARDQRFGVDLTIAADPQLVQAQKDGQALLAKLRDAAAADFDLLFAREEFADHDRDIKALTELRRQIGDGTPVAKLLDETLPTLNMHRDMAQKLIDQLSQH